jgi:hypothetical protein
MKAHQLTYKWTANNGMVDVSTDDNEYYEITLSGWIVNESYTLDYLNKQELIELGEMLIEIGKSK